jgi:hypothetical protein
MPDYLNSKIYMITSSAGLPYIGATVVELNVRLSGHKNNKCASKIHIGQPDCKIELLENYPCNSKNELNARERYWIDNIECCNNNRPIINRDEFLKYQKTWYENNKDYVLNKRKEYREANKEKDKIYREANKEKDKIYQKNYREANKEKNKIYQKNYRESKKFCKIEK